MTSSEEHRPHGERSHVESGDGEADLVVRGGGAHRVEQRQVVVGGGVGESAGVARDGAGEEGLVPPDQRGRDRLVEVARPCRRPVVPAACGREGVPQVVDDVAAGQDEDSLVPERCERPADGGAAGAIDCPAESDI